MAHAISHVPSAIATIIPFDVRHKTERLHGTVGRQSDGRLTMVNPTYELMTASV
jgi:hypothetical protein